MTHSGDTISDGQAGGVSADIRRTGLFLAAGLGMLVAGFLAQPRFKPRVERTEAERVLFPELSDAAKAASLEVVTYDDELATMRQFKVAQTGGVWVLPQQQNYPADAKEQLTAAATELVDRPILDVVSTSPGDHETYGVVEPDPEKVKPGMTGVGRLVEIRDAAGNRLAKLIVGKEDKRPAGAAGAGRTLRFVRKAGQDPVYRVEIDTTKFSTKFDDWIEKDLLKLSPWDVRRLTIDDSSCTFGVDEASNRLAVSQDRRSRLELAYDDKDARWSPVKLEAFGKDNKPKDDPLADDEELAADRLNDLRNALGDLKIVDVARKPVGLSGDLKAEEKFTGDREAVTSLAQRGFYPFQSGEILSSNGETIVGMKDGVEYVLRFGNGTSVAGDADDKPAADKDGGKDGGKDGSTAGALTGRYLFVMARLNEALLEKPTFDPLPEVPGVPAGAERPADADKKAEDKKTDDKKTDDKNPGEKTPDEKKPDDAAKEEGHAPKADADGTKPAAGAAGEQLKQADEAEVKAQAALEERRRVERENRRRQEAYDDKLKAAQKRVRELNNRFADWYYVVSDAEYAKIHLNRAAVVRKKPADGKQAP